MVLATACDDGTVRVFDIATRLEVQRFGKAGMMQAARKAVVWSNDGTTVASFAPGVNVASDIIFNLVSSARLYEQLSDDSGRRFRQSVEESLSGRHTAPDDLAAEEPHASPATSVHDMVPIGQHDPQSDVACKQAFKTKTLTSHKVNVNTCNMFDSE